VLTAPRRELREALLELGGEGEDAVSVVAVDGEISLSPEAHLVAQLLLVVGVRKAA
jgi:hypothetical protein